MGEGGGKDWVTAHPISSGNSIPAPHPPDFSPAQQLQQLLAAACMSAFVYVEGRRKGLWGQEVLPGHVKGDLQPRYNLGGRRRRCGRWESGW